MIDLYYAPTPNGWKISIMLEECEMEYKVIPVNLGKGDQFKPEFLKISPNNRMPAIVDHENQIDGEPLSIFESGAILMYLGEKSGQFFPQDSPGKEKVLEWLFWQVGGLGPMAGQVSHFVNYAPNFPGDHLYTALRGSQAVVDTSEQARALLLTVIPVIFVYFTGQYWVWIAIGSLRRWWRCHLFLLHNSIRLRFVTQF